MARGTPKAPDVTFSKETIRGLEFSTSSYGSYYFRKPLAHVEIFWKNGAYAIKLNEEELVWSEGVQPPTTIDEAARRLILILKDRCAKLTEALSKADLTPKV